MIKLPIRKITMSNILAHTTPSPSMGIKYFESNARAHFSSQVQKMRYYRCYDLCSPCQCRDLDGTFDDYRIVVIG